MRSLFLIKLIWIIKILAKILAFFLTSATVIIYQPHPLGCWLNMWMIPKASDHFESKSTKPPEALKACTVAGDTAGNSVLHFTRHLTALSLMSQPGVRYHLSHPSPSKVLCGRVHSPLNRVQTKERVHSPFNRVQTKERAHSPLNRMQTKERTHSPLNRIQTKERAHSPNRMKIA